MASYFRPFKLYFDYHNIMQNSPHQLIHTDYIVLSQTYASSWLKWQVISDHSNYIILIIINYTKQSTPANSYWLYSLVPNFCLIMTEMASYFRPFKLYYMYFDYYIIIQNSLHQLIHTDYIVLSQTYALSWQKWQVISDQGNYFILIEDILCQNILTPDNINW